MFGKPNNALRSALDAGEVAIKEHRLIVKRELKEVVLHANKCLVILLPCLTYWMNIILVGSRFRWPFL
ncbi:hypothetical protein BDA96_04G385300 [Sorghum bicolor]|uniref:Uncharacterized protein n=1 Tax=Sorghum bicolor TaxID=4558 RepID=A0A921RB30_SORBI|nr:hypothetical protein BDA96_04G385300 [Sorghum bicolor]